MFSQKKLHFHPYFNCTPKSMFLCPGMSVGFSQILTMFFCLQVTIRRSDKEKQEWKQVGVTAEIRQHFMYQRPKMGWSVKEDVW